MRQGTSLLSGHKMSLFGYEISLFGYGISDLFLLLTAHHIAPFINILTVTTERLHPGIANLPINSQN